MRRNRIYWRARFSTFFAMMATQSLMAANPGNYIEGSRAKANIVYLGTVESVQEVARDKWHITLRGKIHLQKIFRAKETALPPQVDILYYGDNEMTGGPITYTLSPGDRVLVFTNSWTGQMPSGDNLLNGDQVTLMTRILARQDLLRSMDKKEMEFHGLTEETHRSQKKLYQDVLSYLNPPLGEPREEDDVKPLLGISALRVGVDSVEVQIEDIFHADGNQKKTLLTVKEPFLALSDRHHVFVNFKLMAIRSGRAFFFGNFITSFPGMKTNQTSRYFQVSSYGWQGPQK